MLKRIVSICLALFASLSVLCTGVASALAETPCVEGDLSFYEGNGCVQDLVFEYSSFSEEDETVPVNDETRSLFICPGANVGTILFLFDAKSDDTSADYAEIYIADDIPSEGVCISTFQLSTSYGSEAVEVVYHKYDCDDVYNDDCLDGQVSYIQIYP